MLDNIRVVCFDADDTLWVNEPYFRETEEAFYRIVDDTKDPNWFEQELYKTELGNMDIYGYGVKAFGLSLIETAVRVSEGTITADKIGQIVELIKGQLQKPLELLPHIEEVLQKLEPHYKLIIATKGDLLDQEVKLKKSNLAKYFHHIEIMSDKKKKNYIELISHLDIKAKEFLMIGNSVPSDVLPVLEIGGHAIHIPFHTTWIHESRAASPHGNGKFKEIKDMREVLQLLAVK